MGMFRQFPYSNFHEMNMDEIIKIVKNMLEEWAQYYAEWDAWMNQMNDDWSNYQEVMNEAWQNMQDFINNYFDNLDVQDEINNKIASMVQSGEFAGIVEPYIPPRVTAWLAEHITEPTGVVIDTSLTVSGACADAKVVGDAINGLGFWKGSSEFEQSEWGYTVFGGFPVIAGHTYKIAIKSDSDIGGTNVTLGLGSNGTTMIRTEALYKGYEWIKEATASSTNSRVFLASEVGTEGVVITASVTDLTAYDKADSIASAQELEYETNKFEYAITALKEALTNLKGLDIVAGVDWEIGKIDSTGNVPDIARIRTVNYIDIEDVIKIALSIDAGYRIGIHSYTSSYEYISDSGWLTGTRDFVPASNARYIRIVMSDTSDSLADISFATHLKTYALTVFYDKIGDIDGLIEVENNRLDASRFKIGSLNHGVYYDASTYPYRIATPTTMVFDVDKYITVENGYRYAYHTLSSSGSFIADSGWQTGIRKIPAGTYFRITMSTQPEGTTTPDIDTYCDALIVSNSIDECLKFSFNGESVNFNKQRYGIIDTTVNSKNPSDISVATVTAYQGFAYYGGVIFQGYSDDVIELLDFSTNTVIADLVVATGHSNCIAFLDEFYDAGDEFPLAIVSDTTANPKAYLVRITRSSATVIREITFDVADAGYYANVTVDNLNGILYTVGYTQPTWEDPTDNKMVIAKWDASSWTQNEDLSYTPLFIENFNVPFINTLQAPAFFNGKLFVPSSNWQNTNTLIYIIDPYTKRITNVISDFPDSIKTHELEGISFFEYNGDYAGLLKTNNPWDNYHLIVSNI